MYEKDFLGVYRVLKNILENYSNFELENYISNTVKLSEIVKEVADHSNETYAIPDIHSTFDGSGKWNIVETYSDDPEAML